MKKEDYIKIVNDKMDKKIRKIMLEQIDKYYNAQEYQRVNKYKKGDVVRLKKGTLLHGTYKNLDGIKDIVNNGLIASVFTNSRLSKYPSAVSVWNLKKDYVLKDYIDFYSGGTIKYHGLLIDNEYSQECKSEVIPFSKMNNITKYILDNQTRMWTMEQTKEARFMPSLIQDVVQIGVIFNGDNKYVNELLKGDILDENNIDDDLVKYFINELYDVDEFINNRHNKDDFFTDRESAILFGVPASLIEGVLVGRIYEKDYEILNEIKRLLPNCYICNLDGVVIL